MNVRHAAPLFLLPLLALADPAPLPWQGSQPEGRAVVRTGYYVNWLRNGVRTPAGDLIVAWSDARKGNFDAWAQKVSGADGSLLWGDGVEPLLVSGFADQQAQPIAVSDGSGGAILVWFDFRAGSGGGALYANRIADGETGSGAVLWPEDVHIHSGFHVDSEFISGGLAGVPDGSGGAWVAWTDQRSGNWDLFLTRIDASGQIDGMYTNGMPIADNPAAQHSLRLQPDGAGGVWLAWIDERNGPDGDVFVEHISADGTRASGDRGALVGGGPAVQQEPVLAVSGNGAWLAWTDREGDVYGNARLQRVGADLLPLLPSGGLLIRGVPGVRESGVSLCVLADGAVLAGWEDSRNEGAPAEADLYMQVYDPDGSTRLADGGAVLCDVPGNQRDLQLAREGDAVFALWQDERFQPRTNLYSQKLDAQANRLWNTEGVSLLPEEASTRTSDPVILATADGGLQGVWFDEGRGAPGLRTQELSGSGQVLGGTEGRELCWGPAGELHGLRLLDTPAGLWSFWIESQTALGNDKLFMQCVDAATGERRFPGEGLMVAPQLEGRNLGFELLADADGGVLVALEVGESYGQRAWLLKLDPDGQAVWHTPATATFDPAGDGSSWQTSLRLARHGEAILLGFSGSWLGQGFHSDLGITAFDAAGQPLWGPEGHNLTNTPTQSEECEALLGGDGTPLLIHSLLELAERTYLAQPLGEDGLPLGDAPVLVTTEPARRSALQAARLANGDLALVWQVFQDDGRTTLAAVGLDEDLAERWSQDFQDGVYARLNPRIAADAWGGLVVGCLEYDELFNQYANVRHILADGSLRWSQPDALELPREGRESVPALLVLPAETGRNLALAMIRDGQAVTGDALFVSAHALDGADPAEPVSRWQSSLFQTPEQRSFLELDLAPDGEGGYYAGWVEQIRLRTQCCVQPIRNVHVIRVGETLAGVDDSPARPSTLELRAWPNPFNPSTRLAFQLVHPGAASLAVYNINGQQVARLLDHAWLTAGTHSLEWQPEARLASGTYLLQLEADGHAVIRQVLLLR